MRATRLTWEHMDRPKRSGRVPPALEEVLKEVPPEVARWFRAHPKYPHNPRYLIDVILTALGYGPQHDPARPHGYEDPKVVEDEARAAGMSCPWCHKRRLDFVPYFRSNPWTYRAFAYCRRRGCTYAFALRVTERQFYQIVSDHPGPRQQAQPTLFDANPN